MSLSPNRGILSSMNLYEFSMHIFMKISMLNMAVRPPTCCIFLARSSTANIRMKKGRTYAIEPNSPRQMSCTVLPNAPVESITTVKNRNSPSANRVILHMTSRFLLSWSYCACISLIFSSLASSAETACF